MRKGLKLPAEHHIVRYVPFSKLRKDENDKIIGVLATAFALRKGESALSVTYLEYFPGSKMEQIRGAVWAIRASDLGAGGKSGFATGNVEAVYNTCINRNHKIRIVYEPVNDNKAHSTVRRLPRDDAELLEILAAETWAELVLNSDINPGKATAPDNPAPQT